MSSNSPSLNTTVRELAGSRANSLRLPTIHDLKKLNFTEWQQREHQAFIECVQQVQQLQSQIPPIAFHGRTPEQLTQLIRSRRGEFDGMIWVAGVRTQVEWPQLFTADLLAGIEKAITYLPSPDSREYAEAKLLVLAGPKIDPSPFHRNGPEVVDLAWIEHKNDDAYLRNQGRQNGEWRYKWACLAERWMVPLDTKNFGDVVSGVIPMRATPYANVSNKDIPDYNSKKIIQSLEAMSVLSIVLDNISVINRSSAHFKPCVVMEKISARGNTSLVPYKSGLVGEKIQLMANHFLQVSERGFTID